MTIPPCESADGLGEKAEISGRRTMGFKAQNPAFQAPPEAERGSALGRVARDNGGIERARKA